jgi:inosine-uridine nucleoside N-ribohydrolase
MIKTLLAVALSWMLLSTAALAENGLERFEREVKPQIQLQTFTYKSAEALGDQGFVLHDVVAVMPANHATGEKERTLKVDKVTVEALDFERINGNTDDAPRFAKLRLEG